MDTILIKLGSIAVHAKELISPQGHEFDRQAIIGLLADKEVREFLDNKDHAIFLPLKRNPKT